MRFLIVFTFILTSLFPIRIEASAETPAKKAIAQKTMSNEVAIISSYSTSYRWSNQIISKVEAHLAERCHKKVTSINIPFIGITNMGEMNTEIENLHKKLQSINPDFVILIGSNSLMLCEDLNKWFPDISILLIGGQEYGGTKEQILSKEVITKENGITTKELLEKYNVTSHCCPTYIEKEIELMRKLMPELENIYMIGGEDQFSRSKEAEMRQILKKKHSKLNFKAYTSDKATSDSTFTILNSMDPKKTAVIFVSWMNVQKAKESSLMMNRSIFLFDDLRIPIFTLRDNGWIEGSNMVLGGCFINEDAYYNRLYPTLTALSEGRQARDIPFFVAGNPEVKLNWNRMNDFNMDPAVCPFGTIFINKPEFFIENHKGDIIGIAFVVFLLIFMLMAKAFRDSRTAQEAQLRELKYKQNELKARQSYYEFIEHMPMGYIHNKLVYDENGRIADTKAINGNALSREKYCKRGLNMSDIALTVLYPKTSKKFLECLNEAKDAGENVIKFKDYFEEIDSFLEIVALFNTNDELSILIKDNTEIEKANENLKAANEELTIAIKKAERAEHLKDEFLKNMTHEVRTPLNLICGFSELIINKNKDYVITDEEKAEMERGIASNTVLLTTLMDNLLEFSDVLNGTVKMETSECNINQIAREAIMENKPTILSGVAVNYITSVADDFTVQSCKPRIKQILSNLISNAGKFTMKGSITLQFEHDSKGICRFICTDTGCGIPVDKSEFIFERFTKIDQYVPGTGLGLALGRSIAHRLNGSLLLDRSYTDGSKFIFEFDPTKRII